MILVTGATGHIGRDIAGRLSEAGASVRALTRHPATASLPSQVDALRGDLTEPESVRRALDGVDRLYLYSAAHATTEFLDLASRAGVRRVVMLSGLGTSPDVVERAVGAAGIEWTHLRPGAFATNALQWAPSVRANGVVRTPYGDATDAPIHEADIGEVAAAALLREDHVGRRYELTGPESLTYREQVALIGEAIGRDIAFIEESPEQARERMIRTIPEAIVEELLGLWADRVGEPAAVLPTVRALTGHPARTFAQWAADHAADFG
ncbi:MAG: NAD(P)H-binding protein [Kutzneria sp.]|nr:NAD(P)H-binding protein [Kutzneria sp.]MBV9847169.1 NAD(P)H-binding protein [Kutzneria sp.]